VLPNSVYVHNMKGIRYVYMLLGLLLATNLFAQDKRLTEAIVNGPDAYFRTYDDFVANHFVPFDNVKFEDSNEKKKTPFTVKFFVSHRKDVFTNATLWGFRWNGQLYRMKPDDGFYRIVAIGEMIMYVDPFYQAFTDGITHQFHYDGRIRNYFSKTLTSVPITIRADPFKTEQNQDWQFFNCPLGTTLTDCFLKSFNLDFMLTRINEKTYKYIRVTQKAHAVPAD
jgi:hypothetical protein